MCRILFLKGNNSLKAKKYVEAFFQSGNHDPYLQDVLEDYQIPYLKNQHIHGWGYILVTAQSVYHYTNGQFFYEDTIGKNQLEFLISQIHGNFLLLAELRLTESGYISAFNAHPFHFHSRNGYEGYLFYNGLLDYEVLAQHEKIEYSHYTTKNGTTLMGMAIARQLEQGKTMQQAIEYPKIALKTAYNIMMYYRDQNGKYKALIHSYLHDTVSARPCICRYNKIIHKSEDDIIFYGASAIEQYFPQDYEILPRGTHIEMEIDFIEEYFFDAYQKKSQEIFF